MATTTSISIGRAVSISSFVCLNHEEVKTHMVPYQLYLPSPDAMCRVYKGRIKEEGREREDPENEYVNSSRSSISLPWVWDAYGRKTYIQTDRQTLCIGSAHAHLKFLSLYMYREARMHAYT